MTWPAPHLAPPRPSTHGAPLPPPHVEDRDERFRRSGLPAATWIALLGGALVLVAAASIVVSNWDAIGRTVRVIGLIAGTGGLLYGSERLRSIAPTTSNIVAHVGTFLTATTGIAALSLFGVTWPGCLVAGGLVALAATAMQSERWTPQLFRAAQVGAIALAATGLGDLTGTTGGLVAALAALGLVMAGAERRAAALAVLAVVSPVLAALADAGIGAGTFERAGLVGERLGWSGPTVGLLAAMVLAIVAHRRRHNGVMVAAGAAPVVGIVTGLAAVDGSAVAWLSLPAAIVLAAEAVRWSLPSDRAHGAIVAAIDSIAATVAGLALLAPWFASEIGLGSSLPHPWAAPAAVTAFALLLTASRWHRDDHVLVDLGIPAVLATTLATVIALGAAPIVSAPLAVAAVAAGAFASRRLHPVAVYAPGVWALVEIEQVTGATWSTTWFLGLGLAAIAFAVPIAARVRRAADRHVVGAIEIGALVAAGAALATVFADGHGPIGALVGVATIGSVVTLVEPRWLRLQLAVTAGVALLATDAAIGIDGLDAHLWIGAAAVAAGFATVWVTRRLALAAHAAATAAVLAAAAGAVGQQVAAESFVAGAMCAVALLTGLALTVQRRSPVGTAAVTAGVVLALGAGARIDPAWVSGIWVVLGLQTVAFGTALRHRLLTTTGAAMTAGAVASWWFTTGLHDWFRELIAPADITVGDLWMLIATTSALLVGWALRRVAGLHSWLAYGAGLLIGGTWLIGVQLDRDPVWAIPAALTLGIVAAGLGAWHRLAAPLVGGTVITAVATFVAAGSDLRAIPTWSWLATGGMALLGLAVLIERTSKQDTSLRELIDRWG